jgi:hypothetical protein
MPKQIKIRAVEGRSLPLLADPRRIIVGERVVPWHSYYLRALARGDIERVGKRAKKPDKTGGKE